MTAATANLYLSSPESPQLLSCQLWRRCARCLKRSREAQTPAIKRKKKLIRNIFRWPLTTTTTPTFKLSCFLMKMYLEVHVQPLLGEIHSLQQLFILTGRLDVLLLHHCIHFLLVLISDRLEPVQGVKLQILVQQLQDVCHTWERDQETAARDEYVQEPEEEKKTYDASSVLCVLSRLPAHPLQSHHLWKQLQICSFCWASPCSWLSAPRNLKSRSEICCDKSG